MTQSIRPLANVVLLSVFGSLLFLLRGDRFGFACGRCVAVQQFRRFVFGDYEHGRGRNARRSTDSGTGSQAPMLVDYVRQYLPSTVPAPQLTPAGSITVTAGATTGNTT